MISDLEKELDSYNDSLEMQILAPDVKNQSKEKTEITTVDAVAVPTVVETKNSAIIDEKKVEDDYERARTSLREIIELGMESLKNSVDIASQAQHPSAYEATASLIKVLSETNEKLLGINKTFSDVKIQNNPAADKSGGGRGRMTDKDYAVFFAGTTAGLLKKIKEQSNNDQ